jgi:hypothetical protein
LRRLVEDPSREWIASVNDQDHRSFRSRALSRSRIHSKNLNADNLAEAIKFCMTEPAQKAAKKMGEQIRAEVSREASLWLSGSELTIVPLCHVLEQDGVEAGVDSFYRHLPLKVMR